MASKTVVELVDDLDGGRADETVSFALDGVEYSIDLSAEHAALLRDRLAGFVGHARRVDSRSRRTTGDDVVTLAQHTAEAPKTAPAQPRRIRRTARRTDHAEPVAEPVDQPVQSPAPEPEPPAQVGPLPAFAVPFQEATR